MKTKLPKKSQEHQEIIDQIRDIIIKKGGDKLASVILYGSFARGDFVYDNYVKDGTSYTYASDFDILIILRNSKHHSSINLKTAIADEVKRRHLDKKHSLSIIITSLKHVNKLLEEGHYFFSDIKKEGILLYQHEAQRYQLKEPKELTNEEKRVVAQKHFDVWFKSGNSFLRGCKFYLNEASYNEAAFSLHQATERLLNCSLLVLTDYKPKTHKLDILNQLCSSQVNEFLKIFPKATKEEKECFDLLNSAYIDARYEENYKITKEQLEYLISRVENLKKITEKVCLNKINSFNN